MGGRRDRGTEGQHRRKSKMCCGPWLSSRVLTTDLLKDGNSQNQLADRNQYVCSKCALVFHTKQRRSSCIPLR